MPQALWSDFSKFRLFIANFLDQKKKAILATFKNFQKIHFMLQKLLSLKGFEKLSNFGHQRSSVMLVIARTIYHDF